MTPTPRNRIRAWQPAASLAALLLAGLVVAADAPRDGAAPDAAAVAPAGAAGLRAVVDPEHGGLRPATAEDLALDADLAAKLSRSSEGLEVVTHPGGMQSVDLQGRFQSLTVMTIDADGRKRTACVHDAHDAAALLHGCVPTAPAPEVK